MAKQIECDKCLTKITRIICPSCKENFIVPYWNTIFNKRIDKGFKHDFGVCDIDSVFRKYYKDDSGKRRVRLLICEQKNFEEDCSRNQLEVLYFFQKNINWNTCDSESGVFILNFDDIEKTVERYTIEQVWEDNFPNYNLIFKDILSLNEFYNIVSVKVVYK